jgi:hypothetical protein
MESAIGKLNVDLEAITLEKGQTITVNLGPKVQVTLRVTPLGQPEIWTDHSASIVRPFEWWYEVNETC